ncbi:MAG: GldG family protein [Pseudohongiellaceae bacterium]
MNSKALFSSAGLAGIFFGVIVSVILITMLPGLRIDLTEDRLYTLSEGTRNIVSNLETPIELRFFYSESATEDQPQIRAYGSRVQELLEEITFASEGKLTLNVIDPEPFSEEEDLATQFGIRAVPVSQGGESIYFGLVASQVVDEADYNPLAPPAVEALPLIRPDQEQFLEYEFMKLISSVNSPERTVIGLITELDIDGGFNPATGQATSPWFVMEMIRQLYDVRRVDINAGSIDEDVDILMIVHPQELSDQMLYAVDQHVMKGGQAIVFLDPNADSLVTRSPQGALIPAGMGSDLEVLLSAWGVEYQDDKVLADNELALRVRMSQNERPMPHLGMVGVPRANLDQEDIITSRLETVNFASAGALSQSDGATTTFEPLIRSSSDAMLMDAALVENMTDPSILFDEFQSQGTSYVLAARVSGEITSAFPGGRPEVPDDTASDDDQDDADAAQDSPDSASSDNPAISESDAAETPEEAPAEMHLAQTQSPANIVLFADTDFLTDRLWVQVAQFLGQRIPQPFANNGDLLINSLDNLSGGADLVSIRSRGTYSRPFTRVIALQREADDRLRTEEADLLNRLSETEAALAELNQDEDGNPLGQLTPEIQAEIDRFNGEMLDTRRRLRDVQFQLTEDIDQLGANLKAINTGMVPVLLTIFALLAHYTRLRRRRSAR